MDTLVRPKVSDRAGVPNLQVTTVAERPFGYQLNSDDADPNIYHIVNQLEIDGREKRIPDLILYINGLPLVVFEFKSAIRENATLHNAFEQLTKRYARDIPELLSGELRIPNAEKLVAGSL